MSETGTGKISIVIPCYNQGALLRETLASVEGVRNANVAEVILVDDGSTEVEVCQIFEELQHSDYKIVHQKNQGPSVARNTGIQLARGEFILPLDSDNFLRSLYLEEGVELLKSRPDLDVVYSDCQYFGDRTGLYNVAEFSLKVLLKGNYIDTCALYRKSLWEEIGGYDGEMKPQGWEDWDFWLRAAVRGARFEHLAGIGYDYRFRPGSVISITNQHKEELIDYIFAKKELRALKPLRDAVLELEHLREQLRFFNLPISRGLPFVKKVWRRVFPGVER